MCFIFNLLAAPHVPVLLLVFLKAKIREAIQQGNEKRGPTRIQLKHRRGRKHIYLLVFV